MTSVVAEQLRTQGWSTLILSHLSLLTEQTFARFQKRAPLLSIGIHQGKRRCSPMNRVVVSTMQTTRLATHAETIQSILVHPIELIIVDEAHYFPSASYQLIRETFPKAKILGLTATPFKDRRLMTSCFDHIAYSISLQELIDMEHLVAPVLHTIPKGETMEITDVCARLVRLYQEREDGKPALVYMRSIDDAKLLRNSFESAGVRARAVTSQVTGPERQSIFDSFHAGDTKVLTTVDVLTAGFDAPPVEAIFMPFGTKSPTQYLQRIGRGLRPHAGKRSCRVYLFGDAPSIARKVYEDQHAAILKAGTSPAKTYDRVSEEMDHKLWNSSSEVYLWNQQVLDVMSKMNRLGMNAFADMLDQRQFPARFLSDLTKLLSRLPDKKQRLSTGKLKPTDAQLRLLQDAGFRTDQVATVSRQEASMMITTIIGERPRSVPPEFVVTTGRYKGQAVWELPHAYRSRVKRDFPESPVAAQIHQWEARSTK